MEMRRRAALEAAARRAEAEEGTSENLNKRELWVTNVYLVRNHAAAAAATPVNEDDDNEVEHEAVATEQREFAKPIGKKKARKLEMKEAKAQYRQV